MALADFTADQAWQSVTLENGWVQYSDTTTYNTVGAYKDAEGMIHLRGLISNPTGAGWTFTSTRLFFLPAGFASLGTFSFAPAWNGRTSDQTTNVVVSVTSNQVLIYINFDVPPACAWLSLDGISFPASDVTNAARRVTIGENNANTTQVPSRVWTKILDYTLPTAWGLSTSELYMDGEGFCYCIYHINHIANTNYANQAFMVVPEQYRPAGHQIFAMCRNIGGDLNTYDGEVFRADFNVATGALSFVNPHTPVLTTRFDGIIGWAPAAYHPVNYPSSLFTLTTGDPFPAIGNMAANVSVPNSYGNNFQPYDVGVDVGLTFQNAWSNYGGGYDVARVYKSTFKNNIRMQGLIKPGSAGVSAFTSSDPQPGRSIGPLKTHIFLSLWGVSNGVSSGSPGEIRVNGNGTVVPSNASAWQTLCGINYRLS